jgi:hypothetical protein
MAQFLTDIQLIATGSIETPDVGFVNMYLNTDGYIYVKFSNGSQTRVS